MSHEKKPFLTRLANRICDHMALSRQMREVWHWHDRWETAIEQCWRELRDAPPSDAAFLRFERRYKRLRRLYEDRKKKLT